MLKMLESGKDLLKYASFTAFTRDQEENWSDIAVFTPYRSGNKTRYCWIHSNRWQVVES